MGLSVSARDRFLNGRLTIAQPQNGFRSGLDAVMLAAAIPAREHESVLELGSGAGVATLCLDARISGVNITGIEIDAALVELARENARANNSKARFVEADACDLPQSLKVEFDHVLLNPPFHESSGGTPPDAARARALHDGGRLAGWLEAAARRTASGGTMTVILRADRMGQALSVLPDLGVSIFPLWPKANVPARRVIVQMRKGARAAMAMLPGLVLHEADGAYTKQADAILRDGAALTIGESGT